MRTKHSYQKGASAVEFALVLPMLMLITFGIIEFALMLYDQQVITNASREAARAGIVSQSTRVSAAEMKAIVDNKYAPLLITFESPSSGPTTVTDPVDPTATPSPSFSENLTVTVTYYYKYLVFSSISHLFGGSFGLGKTLTAQTVMRYE